MTRLTKKTNIKNHLSNEYYYENINNSTTVDVYNKLGKLEDREEQLGCPLEVMFKALEEGIVFKVKVTSSSTKDNFKTEITEERQYESIGKISLGYANNKYLFVVPYDKGRYEDKTMIISLSNYQKTWWLKGEKTNE